MYTQYNWSNITTDTYQYNIQIYIFDLYISPHGSPRQCSSCSPPPYWWILPTNLTNPTQTNEPTKQIYSNLFKSILIRWYQGFCCPTRHASHTKWPSDVHPRLTGIWPCGPSEWPGTIANDSRFYGGFLGPGLPQNQKRSPIKHDPC